MIPENLLFISAQPVDLYFLWQVEVQIVNFRKHGISDKMNVLVWYPEHRRPELEGWKNLGIKYPEVKIFAYPDTGVDLGLYISQLRPHILKKHFKVYEEFFKDKTFFYHDSDIIFNFLPDFGKLCEGDICWQSDTSSYLDYTYLHDKEVQGKIPEFEAIDKLAEIGGITRDIIKSYDRKTGGAQSILKGIDYTYWEDVERMSMDIRRAFYFGIQGSINNRYFGHENDGFQSWTADMWAVNFSLWKRGIKTDITPELTFSWATDSAQTYKEKPIYHNAGATGQPGIFYKGAWIGASPIGHTLTVDPNTASFYYVEAIAEVNK